MEIPEPNEKIAPEPLRTEPKPPASSKPPAGPFRRLLRIVLLSLAGALVLFLAGALTTWIVFTRPAQAGMKQATADLADEKAASQQRIDELAMEVESLSALETRNRELEQELEGSRLEIAVLNTLSEVMTARIELVGKNTAGVRLALSSATKALASLEGLVQADQKEAVKAMQEHLQLVLGEFETNASAAESDLEVLTENLKQLRASNLSQ